MIKCERRPDLVLCRRPVVVLFPEDPHVPGVVAKHILQLGQHGVYSRAWRVHEIPQKYHC